MALSKECGWIKFIKYKISAFFSFHNQQPIPKKPFTGEDHPGIILGGPLYRFCKLILKTEDQLSFLTSILMSKKGFPRPSKKEVRAGEIAAFQKLTGDTKPVSVKSLTDDWNEYGDLHPTIISNASHIELTIQIKRTVKELFGGKRYKVRDRTQVFFPSTSANYINSRAEAGAIGAILQHESLLKGLRDRVELVTVKKEQEDETKREDRHAGYIIDTTKLEERFELFWLRVLKEAEEEEPLASPLGLQEALKIRVITKGPPFLYTVLKPLQRFLWGVLKDHPTFKLIGEPITEEYICERLGNQLKELEYYLSGDYQDATNELASWVSEEIADAISTELKLYPVEARLFKRALTEHIIQAPRHMADKAEGYKKQTTGQLMGSIVSFPVLCIANAVIARAAKEFSDKRIWKLADCPMMINGDDLVLKGNKQCYDVWKILGTSVGLNESVGKTYLSKKFLNMNSTTFRRVDGRKIPGNRPGTVRECNFQLVQYVNLGLIYNIQRSSGGKNQKSEEATAWNTAARARELVRMTPEKLLKRVTKLFTKNMSLKDYNIPWFMPEWIGGLGLPKEMGEPSELDLRMGHLILLNWNSQHPVKLRIPSQWRVRELAEKRTPKPLHLPDNPSGQLGHQEYERLLSLKGVELLFDERVDLQDLLKENDEEVAILKKIRHNERVWRLPKKPLPSPLTLDQIEYRKKIEGIHIEYKSLYLERYEIRLSEELYRGFEFPIEPEEF